MQVIPCVLFEHISGRSFTKKTIFDTQKMENGFLFNVRRR